MPTSVGVATLKLDGRLEQKVVRASRSKLEQIGKEAGEYAHNLAPLGPTGNLKASTKYVGIREVPGTNGKIIEAIVETGKSPSAPYWVFNEYGTGVRGAGSHQPEPGVPAGYKHGKFSKGMTARPYMRRTLWWLKQRFG